MSKELILLMGTAASIGLVHTLIGPDHYVPFIVMARARNWSRLRTLLITVLCGVGHVASSVVLGLIGIAAGWSLSWLTDAESVRGDIAAWVLTAFGLVYLIWGLRRAWKNRPHTHGHVHGDGHVHEHEHTHFKEHAHPHGQAKKSITPWVLFTIFVLGPCEPLIPILMWPAAEKSISGVLMVSGVFAVATIGTMTVLTMLATFGLQFIRLGWIERYSHALAGAMIFACGLAIHLGL
jgi:sulfite exporter TauE/SafE